MTDEEREENPTLQNPETPEGDAPEERFPELAELQREIDRRIRDNQRFLERFLDDDFDDEDPGEEDEIFEEL